MLREQLRSHEHLLMEQDRQIKALQKENEQLRLFDPSRSIVKRRQSKGKLKI